MSFITIPNEMLARLGVAMASTSHTLTAKHQSVLIAEFANTPGNRDEKGTFARTDGNLWKYPRTVDRRAYFKPAFLAADSPVVTPASKPASKPRKSSGKRIKGSPEAIAWGAEMAARRAAKSGKAAPKPVASKPVQASGKLSAADRERLLKLAEENARIMALLAS